MLVRHLVGAASTDARRAFSLTEALSRFADRVVLDERTDDEVMGYDEIGIAS